MTEKKPKLLIQAYDAWVGSIRRESSPWSENRQTEGSLQAASSHLLGSGFNLRNPSDLQQALDILQENRPNDQVKLSELEAMRDQLQAGEDGLSPDYPHQEP